MPLSISSFDFTALLKGALAAVATIAVAWAVTPASLPFDEQPLQLPSTLNELVLERYVLQHASKPVVFVGSSILTATPPTNCRPDNVASLYLQGGSPATGLELIRRIGARPKVLFVEAPIGYWDADPALLGEVLPPIYWRVRAAVPPLSRNRNWMVMLYRSLLPSAPAPLDLPPMSIEDWDKRIEPAISSFLRSKLKMPWSAERRAVGFAARIRELRETGTRVILYSPIDPRLNEITPTKEWLMALKAELGDVEWIDQPDDLPFYRWEGIHFHVGSGLHYFNDLMKRAGVAFEPKCEAPAIFGRS